MLESLRYKKTACQLANNLLNQLSVKLAFKPFNCLVCMIHDNLALLSLLHLALAVGLSCGS